MFGYEETCDELIEVILKLIPDNPSILEIKDPFKLFKIDGFKSNGASLAQASCSLSKACAIYRRNNEN